MNLKQLARTIKTSAFTLAVAATLPALATDYYWIGGESGNWNDGANWSLNDGGAAANAYPSSSDTATVSTSATIHLVNNNNDNVQGAVFSADVMLDGGKKLCVGAGGISGTGTITLAGVTIGSLGEMTISNNLVIDAGTENTFMVNAADAKFYVSGTVTGTGKLGITQWTGNGTNANAGLNLTGDWSGFYGEIEYYQGSGTKGGVRNYQQRALDSFRACATSPYARYDIYATHWPDQNLSRSSGNFFADADSTYRFGTLKLRLPSNKNDKDYKSNVTLEVGNLDEDSYALASWLSASNCGIDWVAPTATFTNLAAKTAFLKISGGGVMYIGSADGLPTSAITFEVKEGKSSGGGVLKSAYDPSAVLKNSTTAPIVFDDEGNDNVWSTSIAASNTKGFTKRGAGTLRLDAVPAYSGTTTIEAGTLILPGNTSLDKLSVAEGASLIVVGLDGDTFTVSEFVEGTTTANVQAAAGSTLSWSGDTATISRSDAPFTWTDATGDHDWANHGNWSVGGVVATTAPLAVDTVLFPAAGAPWTVTLSSIQTVAAVQVNGATTFSGARIQVADGVETAAVTGDGTITLGDNAGFYPGGGDNLRLTVSNNLEIVAAEAAPAKVQGRIKTSSSGGATIRIEGNLTGSGYVEFGGTRSSTYINGDNREFAGYVIIPDDAATAGARRLNVFFKDEYAVSSNAVWTVYNSNGEPLPSGRTYPFGALMGEFNNSLASSRSSSWFELGAANTDFALKFTGVNYGEARQDRIRKLGTGTMTLNDGSGYIREYEFVDGSVCLVGDAAAPSVSAKFFGGELKLADTFTVDISDKIVSSTSPIVFDDGDTDRTWATALAESNVGGLTKKGSGTLTLSEKPLYRGLTTVEAGTLVVPATFTEIDYNPLSAGTISGVTPTSFAYPAGTILTGAVETTKNLAGTLDVSNVTAIDASGVTLTKGQPYVIASATAITGYTKASLAEIALTLPDDADAEKWAVKVLDVDGKRALCVAPKFRPMVIIVR